MKYSKLLLLAAVLFIIGIGCFVGSLALADFDVQALSSEEYTEGMRQFSGISSVSVRDSNNSVIVRRGDGDTLTVEYYDSENAWYDITEDGDTLRIEKRQKSYLFNFFRFDFADNTLTIILPKDYEGTLDIDTSNGSITTEGISAERVELKSSNGAVSCTGGNIAELNAHTSNGSIGLYGVSSDKVDVKTSNGRIQTAALRADECILKTSNASIKAELVGNPDEYRIKCTTSNGTADAPRSGNGPKLLHVDTSNADITVTFCEE